MDCSLPGSSIRGIFQARVLERGASAFSDSAHSKRQIPDPTTRFFCITENLAALSVIDSDVLIRIRLAPKFIFLLLEKESLPWPGVQGGRAEQADSSTCPFHCISLPGRQQTSWSLPPPSEPLRPGNKDPRLWGMSYYSTAPFRAQNQSQPINKRMWLHSRKNVLQEQAGGLGWLVNSCLRTSCTLLDLYNFSWYYTRWNLSKIRATWKSDNHSLVKKSPRATTLYFSQL